MRGKGFLALALLFSLCAPAALAQVDVMFQDDFENMSAGDTPDKFLPSGSANPDWDNQILNPFADLPVKNQIDASAVHGNTSKKYALQPGVQGHALLLGANFNPSIDRYVVVEYDTLLQGNAQTNPGGEVFYTDGFGDLDGTGGATRIAIHLEFNDKDTILDDNGGLNGWLYRTTGQDNNMLTDDGTELTTGLSWSSLRWYRVRVIADQENKTFDLKVTDVAAGTTQTASGLPFNDSNAGHIRKVWFCSTVNSPVYFDNALVYQTSVSPPLQGPTITLQEFSKGPIKTNSGLNVDFSDDVDLASMQYRIGASGVWTDLTTNGTSPFILSGAADTSVTALVWITNTDFAALPQGTSQIYFRAQDNSANTTESVASLSFIKDTQAPDTAAVTVPDSAIVGSLTAISGVARDAVSGLNANSVTFTLQRVSDNWYWNGTLLSWQAAAISLPTTHAAAGGVQVAWSSSGPLPTDTGVDIRVQASVNDVLANGVFGGNAFTFQVQPGYPSIKQNVSSIGPARLNAFTGMDVDFSDDSDLQAVQYRVGVAGAWTDLTVDGVSPFNLAGGADTSVTALVYLRDVDFSALPEGSSDIYFRTTDNGANTSVATVPLTFRKDTVAPAVALVTAPSANPFSSLPTVAGQVGDAAGGSGLPANGVAFTIQRSSDGQYWTGSAWGALTQLAATNPATSDSTAVTWVKNAVIPTLAQLTAGVTYTFGVRATDRAGNTATGSFAALFADVPEVASVTSPASGTITAAPPASLGIQGQAGDHEGGSGLNANSTTFTLQRVSDGQYWNGTIWQVSLFALTTTHGATSASAYANWVPASALPTAGALLPDGDYVLQAKATNRNGGTTTGAAVSFTYSGNPPLVGSGTLSLQNTYITLSFSEKVWSDGARSTAIVPSDFTVSFQQNIGSGGTLTGSTISAFYADAGLTVPLNAAAGYSTVYGKLTNTGSASGVETIVVTAGSNTVYDIVGVVMTSSQTTGIVSFHPADLTPPSISTVETADLDGNGFIDAVRIAFSEAVKDSSITPGDFVVGVLPGTGFATGATANDGEIYISFADGVLGTGDAPTVTYTAGTLTDLAPVGNLLDTDTKASADKASPVILTRETKDLNGSGFIDAMRLVLSEPVPDATVAYANFSFSGVTAAGFTPNAPNDAEIDITFTDGVLGTAAVPTVTYTAGTLADSAGNLVATTGAQASVDKAPPVILTRETADANGSGFIDTMRLVLSEAVSDASVTPGNFGVPGVTVIGYTTGATANDAELLITFTDTVLDTGAVPTVSYTAGTLADLAVVPNLLASTGALSSVDKAPPILMSAVTADPNGNGYIDRLVVQFSEPIPDTNVTAANFTVSGGVTVAGFTTGATADDAVVFINFTDGVLYTDAVPSLTIAPGGIMDPAGNPNALVSGFGSTDDAGPAILTATSETGLSTLRIRFSEPAFTLISGSGALVPADFAYADNAAGNASGISPAAPPDADGADAVVIVTTDAAFAGTDFFFDTVGAAVSHIFDAAGNPASTVQTDITIQDATLPSIASVETQDLDGNALIDAVHIVFSEPVLDSTIFTTDFIVGALTLNAFVSTTNGDTPNDSDIYLTFVENAGYGTAAIPTVTYTAGGLTDLADNPMATTAVPIVSTDNAPPVILARETRDLNGNGYIDAMRLLLSEPVSDATVTFANFGFSGGVTASGFTTGTTADDAELYITFTDGVLGTAAVPTVTYTAGILADPTGNLVAGTGALSSVDKAPPVIMTRETEDANGSGYIDAVRLVLSEAVSDASVTAANFTVSGVGPASGFTTGTTADDAELYITFNDGVLGTGAVPTVTYTAGSLKDLAVPPNSMASTGALTSVDKAPPVLTSVVTADANGDGHIDRLLVQFSEGVNAGTIVAGYYAASSGGITGVVDDVPAVAAVIWVNLADGVLHTDAVPSLTIAPGGIMDTSGNPNILVGAFGSTDGAGPAVLGSVAADGTIIKTGIDADDTVVILFSEATNKPAITAGNIDAELALSGGHTWKDVGGGIAGASWSADGTELTVTLSLASGLPSVAVGDTITLGGLIPWDALNLPSSAASPGISGSFSADTAQPNVLSIVTKDTNGNGYIDRLVVTFDKAVDPTSITQGAFSVSLGTILAGGVVDNGAPLDAAIWINLADNVLSTNALPALSILAGGIKDYPGNDTPAVTALVPADGAPPVILARETADLNGSGYIDAVRLVLSEAVPDATVAAANFAVSGGVTVTGYTTGATANDAEIFVTFTDGMLKTDAAPTVSYTAGTLADPAGNLMANAAATGSVDKVPPAIVKADVTEGFSEIKVTFSEPVSSVSGSLQPLVAADFSYGNGGAGGATAITGMGTDADGADGVVRLAVDALFTLGDSADTVAAAAAASLVYDLAGNPASTAAVALTVADITPPFVPAGGAVTRDVNGDGFVDQVQVTFSEAVNAVTIVPAAFHVSAGTVTGVVDNGSPNDAVILANLADGVLATDAVLTLTVDSGAVQDLATNGSVSGVLASVDGAPPAILLTLAVVGERTVYVKFSEPVSGAGVAVAPGDLAYSDAGSAINFVSPIDLTGAFSREIFVSLANPLTAADVILPRSLSAAAAGPRDAAGNLMSAAARRVTDLYLGVVEPVWASDGGPVGALKVFDGLGRLQGGDISLQAHNATGTAALLRYDVNVPTADKTDGFWLPQRQAGLVAAAHAGAKSLAASSLQGQLETHVIPAADVKSGDRLEFIFDLGGTYCARVVNRKDPRTVAPWSFTVQDIPRRRGGVTILNNVISSRFQDITTVVYSLSERGSVTILVSDITGSIVSILFRGTQEAGDYSATWDGKNRGGRAVAPGLYFVKVVGPGFSEVRKVLVTR